jgi:hypothetical protein
MPKVYDVNGRLKKQELTVLSYRHEAMIDYMLAHPLCTHEELAQNFKFTVAWVGTIIRSDSFRIRFTERKRELIDPHLRECVNARMNELAGKASETLSRQMESKNEGTSLNAALKSFALSMEVMQELK